MRNLKRLEVEIKILEKRFGYHNISYPSNGAWVKISNYKLPQHECRYNIGSITLLLIIPEAYDNIGADEVYIDPDLRVNGKRLPHTHDARYKDKGYQWLCFHGSGKFLSLLDFINILGLYFQNPFRYQRL